MNKSAFGQSPGYDSRRRTEMFHGIYETILKTEPSVRATGFAGHLRAAMQTGVNALTCAEMIGLIIAGLCDVPAEHGDLPVSASSFAKTVFKGLNSKPYQRGKSPTARRRIDEIVIEARARIDAANEPFEEAATMFCLLLAAGAYPPPAAGVLGAMLWARGTDISSAHEDCRRQLDEEAERIKARLQASAAPENASETHQ